LIKFLSIEKRKQRPSFPYRARHGGKYSIHARAHGILPAMAGKTLIDLGLDRMTGNLMSKSCSPPGDARHYRFFR